MIVNKTEHEMNRNKSRMNRIKLLSVNPVNWWYW